MPDPERKVRTRDSKRYMSRFNEGKACDAVIRHIEAREGSSRQNLRSPEREKDAAPIELTCSIGGRFFAFEHTGIEPFERQIELEAKAHFQPLREMYLGKIPEGEVYDLHVPAGATLDLKRAQISATMSALGTWISTQGPRLELAPVGRYVTPAVRQPDAIVPFKVTLHRCALPGVPGQLSVVHRVDLMNARIERACQKKLPKLAIWKARGSRTVLILEGVDDQLTNPVDVAKLVLHAEKAVGNEADEIYFVFSAIEPWSVWHIRVDTRTFFDLGNPEDRAWEVDPQTLSSLTNR
jgi:hypothetical protein